MQFTDGIPKFLESIYNRRNFSLPDYLPKELITFLKQHNGAELLVHPEDRGETHLFSVDEILEYQEIQERTYLFFQHVLV
jgi:hypothetical protein